jgi:Chalcone isomerase-like
MRMSTRVPMPRLPAPAAAALLVLVGLLAGAPFAEAAAPTDCDGVSFPEHIQAGGRTLTLNGLGLRKATVFGIKVYVGALYVTQPTADAAAILSAKEPAEMELRFTFHVTAGQLRDAWQEGFEKSAPGQLAPLRSRIAQLDGRSCTSPGPASGTRSTESSKGRFRGMTSQRLSSRSGSGPRPPARRCAQGSWVACVSELPPALTQGHPPRLITFATCVASAYVSPRG